MDCEKFESLLIDELYGELDEVTSAAVRRHAAGCARCGALLSGLRATRKVAALPMEEPSADLEDRILSAVREQQKVLPFKARASSVLSRAGAWAMRPQTAMAAVFLLVIGTSFVLVQSRSKEMRAASSNAEGTPMVQAAAPAATASGWALEKESAFAHGVEEKRDLPKAAPSAPTETTLALAADDRERDKSKDEAKKNLDGDNDGLRNAGPIGGVAMNDLTTTSRSAGAYHGQGQATQPGGGGGGGGAAAPNMPMTQQAQTQAHSANANGRGSSAQVQLLKAQGCNAAVAGQYDQMHTNEATLEAARCYRALGNSNLARQRYSSLQSTPYAQTAQQELDQMAPAAARKAEAHMPAQVQAAPPRATATTAPAQAKPTDQTGAASY